MGNQTYTGAALPQSRIVRMFRIENWPDAADGIEIAGRLRIGLFARHMAAMPTFWWIGKTRKPGIQIRIWRIGIAYTWKPYCGQNDLPNKTSPSVDATE